MARFEVWLKPFAQASTQSAYILARSTTSLFIDLSLARRFSGAFDILLRFRAITKLVFAACRTETGNIRTHCVLFSKLVTNPSAFRRACVFHEFQTVEISSETYPLFIKCDPYPAAGSGSTYAYTASASQLDRLSLLGRLRRWRRSLRTRSRLRRSGNWDRAWGLYRSCGACD